MFEISESHLEYTGKSLQELTRIITWDRYDVFDKWPHGSAWHSGAHGPTRICSNVLKVFDSLSPMCWTVTHVRVCLVLAGGMWSAMRMFLLGRRCPKLVRRQLRKLIHGTDCKWLRKAGTVCFMFLYCYLDSLGNSSCCLQKDCVKWIQNLSTFLVTSCGDLWYDHSRGHANDVFVASKHSCEQVVQRLHSLALSKFKQSQTMNNLRKGKHQRWMDARQLLDHGWLWSLWILGIYYQCQQTFVIHIDMPCYFSSRHPLVCRFTSQ